MSIDTIRKALAAAGIEGARTATMHYGPGEVQIYTVGGREIVRPAGESAAESAAAIARELGEA